MKAATSSFHAFGYVVKQVLFFTNAILSCGKIHLVNGQVLLVTTTPTTVPFPIFENLDGQNESMTEEAVYCV
jgi:hypothetical protein